MDAALYFLPHIISLIEATRLIGKSLDRIATVMEKEQTQNGAAPTEQSILTAALQAAARPSGRLTFDPESPADPISPSRSKVGKTPPKRGQR